MSAHTKGPWFTHREGFSTIYVEALIGGGMVQETAACGPCEGGMPEQEANARLIAAAPELLAALQEAIKDIELSGYAWDHPFLLRLRATVAKATGGQS